MTKQIDNSETTNGRIYTAAEIERMTRAEMEQSCKDLEAQGFMTRAAEIQRGWAFQHRFSADIYLEDYKS